MKSKNTFGVHFVLRTNKNGENGKFPVYARITVNGTRCEFSLKQFLHKEDWNFGKGAAKPKNDELREFNTYLQEIQGKLVKHFRELQIAEAPLSAAAVKHAFIGVEEKEITKTLLWLAKQHNLMMQQVLKKGSMKNYFTTEKYLKNYLAGCYKSADVDLKDLNYEFISGFEFFVRSHALKENDPCTNNGTMKHLERLKKMIAWAVKNEWLDKNPFANFQLKFRRKERDYLNELELAAMEDQFFQNPDLEKVRDLFVFSCYTGLSYIDLVALKPQHILTAVNHTKWIMTNRAKTEISVNVPLLTPALEILEKYMNTPESATRETIFPKISNQEVNRSLKIIADICQIRKYLTFHLARHTFATTVTLLNGVPIETISKMLGHTKLSTTMIYARVTKTKVEADMELLKNKIDEDQSKKSLKIVK